MRALLRSFFFLVVTGSAGCFALFPLDDYQNGAPDASPVDAAGADTGAVVEDDGGSGFDPAQEHLRFFVTSATVPGKLGGIEGANAICNDVAKQAGRTSEFLAIINTTTTSFSKQFTAPDPILTLPIADYANQLIAKNLEDLLSNGPKVALNHTETGAALEGAEAGTGFCGGAVIVWSNTSLSGKITSANSCSDWTSAESSANGTVGSASDKAKWGVSCSAPCDTLAHLYCIEK